MSTVNKKGTTKLAFHTPDVPDQDFFDTAKSEFVRAMESVVSFGADKSHERSWRRIGETVSHYSGEMSRWVDDVARELSRSYHDAKKFRGNMRLMRTFLEGIGNKDIEFNDLDSLNLFETFYDVRLKAWCFPQVVEYYTKKGELMELKEEMFGLTKDLEYLHLLQVFTVVRAKLLRLYTFDVNAEHENKLKGEEHVTLPLDVRLHFSGFHDDGVFNDGVLSDEEIAQEEAFSRGQHYQLDHTDPSTLSTVATKT